MTMTKYLEKFTDALVEYAPNVLAALLLLIFGFSVIRFMLKIMSKIMVARKIDETLQSFAHNLTGWALKILLFIMVASKLGVETTSFAALIAAAGLGVGFALQGALGNLAGGVIIMLFRPFKIGDYIDVQGEKGFVEEIQIFSTIIKTFDNKTIYVPNGSLSNGNITNLSQKGTIRLGVTIGVDYASDIKKTREVFLSILPEIKGISKKKAPAVVVSDLADSSINFTIFVWVTPSDYWPVRAEILERGKEALDANGIEIPFPHQVNIRKE